jgi:glycosyltransferase involved in cell wall biosynthesis
MSNPTVSVVMSVFNGEAFLHEAVTSILGQTYEDFEFIIIDDGSTDGSARMLDEFQTLDSRIRLFHQPNP